MEMEPDDLNQAVYFDPYTPENGWIYVGYSLDGGQFFWKRDEMADYAPESEPVDG